MPQPSRTKPGAATQRRYLPKRRELWAVIFASMMLLVLLPTASAHAATGNNGYCEPGEFCLYFNSNYAGSMRDYTSFEQATYFSSSGACHTFTTAGNGQGVCVKNNAASAWNRKTAMVTVYYNSYFGGTQQSFGPGASGNLSTLTTIPMKNNNASHRETTYAEPVFEPRQSENGVTHFASVTFRASDLYKNLHVRRVYVRITRLDCGGWPDGDTGRVYSAYASSISDRTTYKVYTELDDSLNIFYECIMKSYKGYEYFPAPTAP